jgi:hypothetical protein
MMANILGQSYDFELQRQRCKFYSATSRLVRFEIKIKILPLEKRSSLLQRWRYGCKFQSGRIGSMSHCLQRNTDPLQQ